MNGQEQEIAKIKEKRNRDIRLMTDRAKVFIVRGALPSMLGLVGLMVYSAIKMQGSESIGIISALITVVVSGLLQIMRGITGTEKDDPMHNVTKEIIENQRSMEQRSAESQTALLKLLREMMQDKDKSQEIVVGDKGVKIVEGDTRASVGKDLIWGDNQGDKKKSK